MNQKKSFMEKYVKIIVIFAVICGASSGIFGKAMEMPPMAIGFWRLTLGLPFFAVPVLLRQRDTLTTRTKKELAGAFAAGAFLFVHFFCWFSAVKLTNIGSASVLASLHPLVVLILTFVVLKQKVGRRPIMGIVLALLGGAMVAGFDYRQLSAGNFRGDLFALGAGIFMGVYYFIGSQVRKTVPGPTYVVLCFFACWVCFAIGMAATGTPALGYSLKDYILVLGLTIVCQLCAHAVFNLCFGYVDSLYVSAWESGESVFSITLSILFLHQFPSQWEIVGCLVVVVGLLYYTYWADKESKGATE